ncbi:MAG: hypothetical protein FJ319_08325 [SAR202 cluster bacterium]|nr:hypothetical protein [SAR202 cluster bacterium]
MGQTPRLIGLPLLSLLLLAVAAGAAALACGARENPFAVGDRGTPTPTAAPDATARPTQTLPWFDHEGKDIMRIGEWPDKPVQLANAMTGYIMVHGFDYNVEIIPVEQEEAGKTLLNGEIHVITMFDREASREWYDEKIKAGKIIDLGAIYESKPDVRIISEPTMKERAAELVTFYGKVKPGDEAFDAQAAGISTGRIGINPVVAAITYFKNNSTVWQPWVPSEIASRVSTAITDGKASLRNRACIPREMDCIGPVSTATPRPAGR